MARARTSVARGVLAAIGLLYVGIGLAALLSPATVAGYADITLEATSAKSDVRAVYGGLAVGLGVFFLVGAVHRPWVGPALLATLLTFVGLLAGRITSVVLDGSPGAVVYLFTAAELLGAVASGWALLRLRETQREEPDTEGPAAIDALK